jgi:hexosaminidase
MYSTFLLKQAGISLLLTILVNSKLFAQHPDTRYPIIPYPASLEPATGEFAVTRTTSLMAPSLFTGEAAALNAYFSNSLGRPLKPGRAAVSNTIILKYDSGIRAEEGYELTITPQRVILSARTTAGMFMAVQTVRQLLPASAETPGTSPAAKILLPAVIIKDAPQYAWRGMHLDVSRHFFSIAYLRKFIDVMALYKFNTIHLHLTDDQGWRIEIKKYPKLTANGAWRTFNNQDSACMRRSADNPDMLIDTAHIIQKDGKTLYGGFYTQKEMKALVAYAAAKHITIIPEIDMPGHMMAAIDQYPYLSCDGTSVFGKLFSTPICPCLPSTFQFAQDVYTEIMEIFPSKYLHIGGDEVDRSLWAKSVECRQLMEKEGLKNTAELQSYFIRKMEAFFNSKGRKLIGWDEILEGGISKTALVMYWRSWVPKAPVEAAKNGNQVIMTPGNPLYFDALPDRNSLPAVYNYAIIPKGLTAAEAKNIIGAQANIWTEYIPTENRADYMYMPRMTALAEVLWSSGRDYTSYLNRLQTGYQRLDALNVHYRLPDLSGFLSLNVFTGQDTLNIKKPQDRLTIRYTTDSTAPTIHSTALDTSLIIRGTQQVRVAAFRPDGSRGDIYTLRYEKQTLAEQEKMSEVSPGFICSQYKGSFKMTSRMPDGAPDTNLITGSISVPAALEAPAFGLKYRGYLDIPQDGVYSFYLTCDDGGVLRIAGREVVNNDGNHSAIEKNGQVALKKGLQKFALDFIEGGGGYVLKLKYSFNGSEPQDIPALWIKHQVQL